MERSRWWERGLIYQIYPRSFQDSDGDGIGDLPGIRSRLDYLAWLGVDILWICPFYPSPMADLGYDVCDYTGVDPLFGTLDDFDRLLQKAHALGLRVILDFVPNHTSQDHPWFRSASGSRTSPHRPWYIWKDPAPGGGPPTNWLSAFGGSAWSLDRPSGQYYLHTYLREQPDLNWRCFEVRGAMLEAMRFWLARGIDGFRLDALWHLMKDEQFRDNPSNPDYSPGGRPYGALHTFYCGDRPEIHPLLREIRKTTDEFGDVVLVGEMYLPVEKMVNYYGRTEAPQIHLPTNFELLLLPWKARRLAAAIDRAEAALPPGAWPHWALGNHDKPRLASRVGEEQTRTAAMLLLMLRGTPSLYYGDELGLRNLPVPTEEMLDPWERNVPGRGLGRDPFRAPMPWEDGEGGGFTTGRPWLPLDGDTRRRCVARQKEDPGSLLHLYRRLIALRRQEEALHRGDYFPVPAGGHLLAFVRQGERKRFLIALNLGARGATLTLRRPALEGEIVLGTGDDREGERFIRTLRLSPGEGVVARLEGTA